MGISYDTKNFIGAFFDTIPEEFQEKFDPVRKMKDGSDKWQRVWVFVAASNVVCSDPPMFIRIKDKRLISRKAFDQTHNALVNMLPDLLARYRDNASKYATGTALFRKATKAVYEPGNGDWICERHYNLWKRPPITPLAEKPEQFLAHIDYLIPDERERELFLNWLAWAIQRPMQKLQFALLLVGRKGTGKSWLAKLMPVLFGRDNALIIPNAQRAEGKFNAENANRQIIFIDEILPGRSSRLLTTIEPMITQSNLWIEPKGIDKFEVANRFNIMAVTNFDDALPVTRDARRWAIVRTTDDVYGLDDGTNDDYYNALHAMTPDDGSITDEARRILWYFQQRDLSGFNGQGLAPNTAAKNDMAEATETDIQTRVHDMMRNSDGPFRFCVFTVRDVAGYIPNNWDHSRMTTKEVDAEIVRALQDVGCRRLPQDQIELPNQRARLWAVNRAMFEQCKDQTRQRLRSLYVDERELFGDHDGGERISDFDEA